MKRYSVIVEYAGLSREFVVDFPEEFFPSEEGRSWMGDEKFEEMIHQGIVDDFYSKFNLQISELKATSTYAELKKQQIEVVKSAEATLTNALHILAEHERKETEEELAALRAELDALDKETNNG